MITVGVLALQGAFIEHMVLLKQIGVASLEVRLPEQLADVDGLIIPGGESTTIGKLAVMYGLMEPLREFAKTKPMWGTCAGMIFMAKEIDQDQPLLGVMDIVVERNAFGRQIDSFEIGLDIPAIATNGRPFDAIFIRAPKLIRVAQSAEAIAALPDGTLVAAKQEHMLVTSFHPELNRDARFHQYFVDMIRASQQARDG